MKQTTFASVAWEKKGKGTRRERLLAEMDQVIPWASILSLIEPHYPKAGTSFRIAAVTFSGIELPTGSISANSR